MTARDPLGRRRNRLIRRFEEARIDGLLVTNVQNVRYLSGFTGGDGALLVTPAETSLLTDGRYDEQAARETRGIEIRVRKKELMAFAAWTVRKAGVARLGVEAAAITLAESEALKQGLRKVELKPVSGLIEKLRIIKDRTEIATIRQAVWIAERAFLATLEQIEPGKTELAIARRLDRAMEDLDAEGPAFPTIVAAGKRSSLPHARPTNRKVRKGDAVLVDWGARLDGYHSDLTRMVFLDRISPWFKRLYEAVLGAQRRAIAQMRPGRRTGSVDASVRACLKAHRLNKYFTHGLGHGLGLMIHETPVLGARGQEVLKPGMVCTAEPGVYFPGRGGVRIEDDILITHKGHRVLTSLPKSLDAFLLRSS